MGCRSASVKTDFDAPAVGKSSPTLRAAYGNSAFSFKALQRLLSQLSLVEYSLVTHNKFFDILDWRSIVAKTFPQLYCQWFSIRIEQQPLAAGIPS